MKIKYLLNRNMLRLIRALHAGKRVKFIEKLTGERIEITAVHQFYLKFYRYGITSLHRDYRGVVGSGHVFDSPDCPADYDHIERLLDSDAVFEIL